jgi:hypothetical protein
MEEGFPGGQSTRTSDEKEGLGTTTITDAVQALVQRGPAGALLAGRVDEWILA